MTAIADLEIFARVARTGNMSAAGREMGLSPAVVSKRISMLEDNLGARLFQRTTRQLTLTETGEGYFKRVVDILSLVDEAEDFVNRRNDRPRGILKVTAPTSFSRQHIAPYLREFHNRYPEIELDLHLTDNFVDIIGDGFDVAVRIGELKDSSLVAKKIAPDHRVICASRQYIEENGDPETLADLEHHNCLSAGAQDQWRLSGPDGDETVRVSGNIRSNSAEFIREALLSGLGIALRSIWDIGQELKSGELQILLPDYRGSSKVSIYAVYPCREFMPTKVNAFIEFLSEVYGNDNQWKTAAALDAGNSPAHAAERVGEKTTDKTRADAAAKGTKPAKANRNSNTKSRAGKARASTDTAPPASPETNAAGSAISEPEAGAFA